MTTPNDTTKRCPRCKLYLPLTADFFGINRSEKSGFNCYCRDCWREISREKNAKRREAAGIIAVPEGMRRCGHCGEIYPSTREHFSTHKIGKDGLQSFCKTCMAAIQKEYRKTHPENVRATERKRSKNPKRQEQNRVSGRIRYQRDPDKNKRHELKINVAAPEIIMPQGTIPMRMSSCKPRHKRDFVGGVVSR